MEITPLDKLIDGRRSIRKYKPECPPQEWVRNMILAAMRAPSPSNSQPVRFIRILSPELKDRMLQAMRAGEECLLEAVKNASSAKRLANWVNAYSRFSEFMFDAPVLFAVGTTVTFLNLAERLFRAGAMEQGHKRHRDIDIAVGLALKGYLLKGEEFGLGSCILTAPLIFIQKPEDILGLKGMEIKCFVTTGYPNEEPAYVKRKEFTEVYREI
ncbi:MAG TPA: nitroreductase family protein [Syntrophales bacterium]